MTVKLLTERVGTMQCVVKPLIESFVNDRIITILRFHTDKKYYFS